MSVRCLFAAVLLALLAARAEAGEFVQFKAGETTLAAYMAKPAGTGPFPAVVVLHGCGGFHSSMLTWADNLARWGFVGLAVDSFGPRHVSSACGGFAQQPGDAFAALHFLAGQSFVRADRVAVMGFSLGGGSTLAALEQGSIGSIFPDKFRAGVALYPMCRISSGLMTTPTLILIGSDDDWTPAADCEDMVAGKARLGTTRAVGDRSNVKLIVYPGARHAYDVADLGIVPEGVDYQGHRLKYDAAATRDSFAQVRAFLQEQLKN